MTTKLQMATDDQLDIFEPIEGDGPDSLESDNWTLKAMGAVTPDEVRLIESKTQASLGQTLLGKLTMAQRNMVKAQSTMVKAEESGDERNIRVARTVYNLHRAKAAQLQRRIYGNVYGTGRNRKRGGRR